jgi:hypothetical protein
MKSRALRALFVLLALSAQAGAGYQVWRIDEQVFAARSAATDFDRKARLAVLALADIRAAEQAYVAEGQAPDPWLTRMDGLAQATAQRITDLRVGATSADAQGSLEAAVETFSAFGQSDAKARDYVKSAQRLSASDVIFTDGASLITRATGAIDAARGQESVAREVAIAALQQQLFYWIGGAALVTLIVLLLLLPIPKLEAATEAADADQDSFSPSGGLGLSQMASERRIEASVQRTPPAPAPAEGPGLSSELDRLIGEAAGPDLPAVADICAAFARVEDPRELHGLLERTAKALEATGLIIWMPEGAQGALRPVLAYGYAPLSLTRMGTIDPAADNATAVAYRTRSVQMVVAEPHSSGAIVAPLVTSDGCSGTMSVELKEGIRTTPQLKAVATILAAQLATLITPSTPSAAQEPPPART